MNTFEVPDWLTKQFLEKVLKENLLIDSVEIRNYDIESAVPKWNNYLSTILRIVIEYNINEIKHSKELSDSIKKISIIIKIPVQNEAMSALNTSGIFDKETAAYTELLPKLHEIINTVEKHVKLTPKYYKCHIDNIIILEDLRANGYIMADRREQLDYEHGVMLLQNLAKFHAASVRLREIEPDLIEKMGRHAVFCKNMDEKVKQIFDPLIGEEHIEMIRQELANWPETRKYVDFLSKLKPKFWDIYLSKIYPDDGEFTVLNHGDLWTNNVMFQRNDRGKPQKFKFIDLQLLRNTSPTMDILNCLYTSIKYDVLKEHLQDFLKIYFDDLNKNLENYGSSARLNEKEFRKSLENREIFTVITCINSLPFVFSETEDNSTETTENAMKRFIQNKVYRTLLPKYLEEFTNKPWFKCFE